MRIPPEERVQLVLRGLIAKLVEAGHLELAYTLPREIEDVPDLLERHPTPLRDVESAGLLELPRLLVREVHLDRPGLGIDVEVQVVLARNEQTRPWPAHTFAAVLRPIVVD